MKKVLFATTALVATAGVAAADVTFGGYGRFGLQHRENRGVGLDDTIIESRFRLNIDASTESDAGVTFGARIRIQADDADGTISPVGNAESAAFNGARFHAETGGFRLEVGNIAHALDNLANYFGYEPGLIGAVGQYNGYRGPKTDYASAGSVAGSIFGGQGVNGISAIYSVGDFRAQLSYDDDNDGAGADLETTSVSLAYTFSGWTVALGHERSDDGAGADLDGTVLTVGGSLGVADVAFFIGDADGFDTAYGVSGRFDVGAATAIVASIGAGGDTDGLNDRDTSYGIGFDHDLGGGVALKGMVGRNSGDQTVADLGVQFNF